MSTAHVVWDNDPPREVVVLPPERQFVVACRHCGDRYVFALPAPVDVLGACLRAYAAAHAECKPRGER